MSRKIYHLTIEFDPDTEEVEYLIETVDEVDEGFVQLTQIGTVDLETYFDKETLKEILLCYEVGEA
jgi:Ca2+-binding EF-hand superfamily protein|tara:strand:- start:45 stop:242 length:198 start_codon:yes stop_codon:yes gene_type:complete